MKTPRVEHGVVVGTGSNKYETKNPIARYAITQLLESVVGFASACNPSSILEIGCGEGHITERLLSRTNATVHATDLSPALIKEASSKISHQENIRFSQLNIYDLAPSEYRSDLVVCCEVLEHLKDPEEGLRRLAATTRHYAVLSVPREPNFRILNFLRGQHVRDFGNAPGHVQHWSSRNFIRFLEAEFDVLKVRKLLPWTVVLARPKGRKSS